MKFNTAKLLFAMGAAVLFAAMASSRAQQDPLGGLKDLHATDFTSVQYFEAPDEQKIKMRVSGAEATPLPKTMLAVKQLKLEMFSTNGTPDVVVNAPQCTFAPLGGWASSPGRVKISSGDGKSYIEGEGFLLSQTNSSLNISISNHVHTVIEYMADKQGSLL